MRSGFSRAARNPSFVIGAVICLAFLFVAVFADQLAPYSPYSQSLLNRFKPPFWYAGANLDHVLGTDAYGRDYLSRLIYGARISIMVGVGAATVGGIIGTTMGVLAGYFRGWTDSVISFLIASRLAIPGLLFALAVLQLTGPGLGIVILVLALTHWDRFAVVMRTATLQVRSLDYVVRARAMGASTPRILLREIFPNVLGSFIVVFTFEIAQTLLAAAMLSFLGLGLQPPTPSWGLMMSEGRSWMLTHPWLITIAGSTLMLLILGINLVGDALRDLLAPEGKA